MSLKTETIFCSLENVLVVQLHEHISLCAKYRLVYYDDLAFASSSVVACYGNGGDGYHSSRHIQDW